MINLKFTDGIRQYEVIEKLTIRGTEVYRLKNYTENRENEIMKEEQINSYLNNQEFLKERYNRVIKRQKENEREILEEKQKQIQEQEEYNFCYGYLDNKTPLQRGKILKALNNPIAYEGEIYTRKDWIKLLIERHTEDIFIKEVFNTNRYSNKKVNGEHKKLVDKLEIRFYLNKDTFVDITKTEKDYANYLLKNKIDISA